MEHTSNATLFLLQALFGIAILVFMLRFLMQLMHTDAQNPLSRIIIKLSNPILRPARIFLPSSKRIDLASLAMMFATQMALLFLAATLKETEISWLGFIFWSAAELLSLAIGILFWSTLLVALFSWFQPQGNFHPGLSMLAQLIDPLLRPIRNKLPMLSGAVDFSPLILLVGLQFFELLTVAPLRDLAQQFLQ